MVRINTTIWIMLRAAAVAVVFSSGICAAREPDQKAPPSVNDAAFKQFQQAGKNASITVLPTLLAGNPMPQVGNVIAMLLERGGMSNVQNGAEEFKPPQEKGLAQSADALSTFVKAHQFSTDYILFNEFRVSPQRKFTEVRSIVVNRAGEIVWTDSQTTSDADFKRINPNEPMECCVLVAERIRPVLKLEDSSHGDAREGKLTQKWQKETGVPDKAELAAIEQRQDTFKKAAAGSTLLVYPTRIGDESDSASAKHINAMINKSGLAKASAADHGFSLQVKPSMNEQKVLWSMARAFRDDVRKSKPDADYVLFADYLMNGTSVGAVHFVVCDRQGEWVVVDYQNSHHPDFKAIHPKSRDDCDRLVLKRMQQYCK